MKKCHTSRDQLTEHLRENNSLYDVISLQGLFTSFLHLSSFEILHKLIFCCMVCSAKNTPCLEVQSITQNNVVLVLLDPKLGQIPKV